MDNKEIQSESKEMESEEKEEVQHVSAAEKRAQRKQKMRENSKFTGKLSSRL